MLCRNFKLLRCGQVLCFHNIFKNQLKKDLMSYGAQSFIEKRYASENHQIPISFPVKSKEEFTSRVLCAKIPIIVQFGAEWCESSRYVASLLESEIANYPGRLMAARVDVDFCGDMSYQYKVFSLPMLLLFMKGNLVESLEGAMEKDSVRKFVKKALSLK